MARTRRRTRDGRPRRLWQRPADELGCRLRRASRRTQGRRADRGAGADGQSALRVWDSVSHQRRADDPARRSRCRPGRRHREHEPGAAHHPRAAQWASARAGTARGLPLDVAPRPVLRLHDGGDRRELRREVRHLARGAGPLRAPQPAARRCRVEGGPLRRGNRAGRDQDAQGRRGVRRRRPHASRLHARGAREAVGGVQQERLRHGRQRLRHRRRRGGDPPRLASAA